MLTGQFNHGGKKIYILETSDGSKESYHFPPWCNYCLDLPLYRKCYNLVNGSHLVFTLVSNPLTLFGDHFDYGSDHSEPWAIYLATIDSGVTL